MNAWSLLIASLVGSAHCAVMCGGFAVGVSTGERPHLRLGAWHLGRGTGYALLGGIAGWAGGRVDGLLVQLSGFQSIIGPVVGGLLLYMAAKELGWVPKRTPRVKIREPRARRTHAFARVLRWAQRDGVSPALALGAATALLPCGWLWAALAVAAATGGALAGMVTMAAFWLGTVPLLTAIGGASGVVFDRVRQFARPVLVVALIAGGLLSMTGHLLVEPSTNPQTPVCHG